MANQRAVAGPPTYVLTGGLAILFLFPIVWAAVASVSPSPGSNQVFGYGLGNYAHAVQLRRRACRPSS